MKKVSSLNPPEGKSAVALGKVLLAEDNESTQELIRILIGNMGFSLTIVNNGQEAVEIHTAEHFDLVLMDCHMPVMDGLEATRKLRNYGIQTPVIALTANVHEDDIQCCREAGMNDCICKPFRQNELMKTMLKWLTG
ncbi:MAG: response regulator [Deltaproteobacteria bacterium]|jgi:CheY-like chemotaxis protein|nr:response regulator [Deltaproteobacteria bacterium]